MADDQHGGRVPILSVGASRRSPLLSVYREWFHAPQLGEQSQAASAPGRSRGEAAGASWLTAPQLWDRCACVGCPRQLYRHLTASCDSIPRKRLIMPTTSAAGMTRSESAGRARRYTVAPAPCTLLQRALAKVLFAGGDKKHGRNNHGGVWYAI